MIDRIQWLGHGGFAILDALRIYINPRRIARPAQPADIVLISHHDYALCSTVDIDKLRGEQTHLIVSESALRDLPDGTVLRPWQSISIGRACIKAVPAERGVGFVISMNYHDIYYAGDSGLIPEMSKIRADIALLPLDESFTAQQAADLVATMRPRYVIPYNGRGGATPLDALAFARMSTEATQVILPSLASR
jgi:L-ascorbate metabolism protein UlaG (beta-lactamase superfamily)